MASWTHVSPVAGLLMVSMFASPFAPVELTAFGAAGGSGAASKGSQAMEIKRLGTQQSQKGPADHFTGKVRIEPLFQATAPSRASGAYVTFQPCARGKVVDWMEKVTDEQYGAEIDSATRTP